MSEDRDQAREITLGCAVLQHGFVQIPVVVVKDPRLSAGAKLAYGGLLWYAWRGQECPGRIAMAAELGMTTHSIQAFIWELVEQGYIDLERHGRGAVSTYRLLHPWPGPQGQDPPVSAAQAIAREHADEEPDDNLAELGEPAQPAQEDSGTSNGAVALALPPASEVTTDELVARLKVLRMRTREIRDLLKEYGPVRTSGWLSEVEEQCRSNWPPNNPPGLLVSLLRSGEDPPQRGVLGSGDHPDSRQLAIAVIEARIYGADLVRAREAVEKQWPGLWPEVAAAMGVWESPEIV